MKKNNKIKIYEISVRDTIHKKENKIFINEKKEYNIIY